MADSQMDHGAPSGATTSALLPRSPSVFVAKADLLRFLDRREPLTIVRGPRGFGKTSLVAHWARSLPGTADVVWVSCRMALFGEGRARTVWEAIGDALSRSGIAAERVQAEAGASAQLEAVLRELKRPLCLVLDDFHHVTDPAVEAALVELVRKFESLNLVVCLGRVASIETVRAATIDSVVIRPAELLLTETETSEVARRLGRELAPEDVRALHAESGGWPALVRAILSNGASTRGGTAGTLDLRAGDPFLRSVWQELGDRRLQRVILRTALLDEFTAEDARWCSGIGDVGEQLAHLSAAGILVSDGTGEPAVHHYVPAVRRACVALLKTHDPRQFKVASRRAAEVCVAHGRTDVALGHLLRSASWTEAAQLIDVRWVELVAEFPEDVAAAVERMPREVLERHARLVIARDHLLPVVRKNDAVHVGDGGLAGFDPSDVGPRTPWAGDEVFALPGVVDAMEQSLAQIALLRMTGNFYAAKEVADRDHDAVLVRVDELHDDVRQELAPVLHEWAVTRLLGADLPGALSAFREAVELATAHDHPEIVREASVGAALACAMLGYLQPAEEWLVAADRGQTAASAGPSDRIVDAVRGIVALERVQIEGLRAARSFDVPKDIGEFWALAVMIRAQVALVDGTHFQILGEIEAARSRSGGEGTRSLGDALLVSASVDLHLALGHISRARLAINAVTQTYEATGLARARTEYLSGEFARASEVALQWLRTRIYAPRHRLDFLVILAASEQARGRRYEAAVALDEAVAISEATGITRAFLKVPRRALLDLEVEVPRIRVILEQPGLVETGELFPAPTISAQLSDRERQVLESLARNTSLAGVARSLYLSSNTVKTHLRSIYRKLGTHSSVETVERAFELGIIERPS
ncbi:LuxR C-terminal-related transcriptional regulator [Sanguibacter sp. 25GB23B1]|uniref:LuxR C-terminal-related transcriptional regulator n=1 Tax=unclassified Sanguibacter TaxID=2645534 RepID=UPI0032AF47C9